MAVKGQRFRRYSAELKEEVLKKYLSGVSASVLAEQYGVPRGTIKTWKRGIERGMAYNGVCHVRPHGQDASDTYQLPVRDKLTGLSEYTKQCFWLNNSFVREIIKK